MSCFARVMAAGLNIQIVVKQPFIPGLFTSNPSENSTQGYSQTLKLNAKWTDKITKTLVYGFLVLVINPTFEGRRVFMEAWNTQTHQPSFFSTGTAFALVSVTSLKEARKRTTSPFSFLIGTTSRRHQNLQPVSETERDQALFPLRANQILSFWMNVIII